MRIRLMVIACLFLAGAPVALSQITFTEYPLPTPGTFPREITTGPDGNLWFSESVANKIGVITTGGVFAEFPLPNGGSFPFSIAAGSDGKLWFAERFGNRVGNISTPGMITEYSLGSPNQPTGIALGPDVSSSEYHP